MFKQRSFTLIELLIVVAIIGILAAIAVPNFMNARMRATIAKMETDLKALGDALMMYRIDNKCYFENMSSNPAKELRPLTTPVAYIASIPQDPFRKNSKKYKSTTNNYDYTSWGGNCRDSYVLHGLGPDTDEDIWSAPITPQQPRAYKNALYNPSNGLISSGDVMLTSWDGLSF